MSFPVNEKGGWVVPAGTKFEKPINVPPYSCFGSDCVFFERTVFGEYCTFSSNCNFVAQCAFNSSCRFGIECTFSYGCTFDSDCRFDSNCDFNSDCVFNDYCNFGSDCNFNSFCELGRYSCFGAGCKFGEGCRLGAFCTFDGPCYFSVSNTFSEGTTPPKGSTFRYSETKSNANGTINCTENAFVLNSFLALSGVDGSGRQVRLMLHNNGISVAAGCFFGTVDEFCNKAVNENKYRYANVIKANVAVLAG